jgi:hypothetical protein
MGITSLISYIGLGFGCAQVKLVVWTGLLLLSLVNNLCAKRSACRRLARPFHNHAHPTGSPYKTIQRGLVSNVHSISSLSVPSHSYHSTQKEKIKKKILRMNTLSLEMYSSIPPGPFLFHLFTLDTAILAAHACWPLLRCSALSSVPPRSWIASALDGFPMFDAPASRAQHGNGSACPIPLGAWNTVRPTLAVDFLVCLALCVHPQMVMW